MQRTLIYTLSLALGAAIFGASATSQAGTVFSDDFNKSDQALLGTTANIGGTWTITGTSTVNPLQIAGNAVPMNTTGQDAYSAFSSSVANAAGTVLHTSMDINLSAVGTGDYFTHLSDPAGTTTNFYERLGAASSGAGYVLQLADTGGGGATTTLGTTVLNLNQTYHVDAYWTFVAGATNDTFQINVDNLPYLNKTWTSTNAEPTQLSAVNLRQGTNGSEATVTVDNLQVESIVVPEPCSLVLVLFGLAGFGLSRRR